MFYQVRVQPDDCKYLRFLWWPHGDLGKEPEEYRMLVHLFGGASSPSCANYALKRTAEDNKEDFDAVTIATVKRNFYVDDCLKSVPTNPKAVKLGLGWDDPIPETSKQKWEAWLRELPKLEQFQIRRCFKPQEFSDVKRCELNSPLLRRF
ncbi:uncharacterized protein [Porites lutea]|uniref:uncharacterized protein n=1 Tax=Porites lutea TaxID=51062 RepID=UPI003CC6D655